MANQLAHWLALVSLLVAMPAGALDDLFEVGTESVPYMEPMDSQVEFYRRQIEGMDFTTFLFSPALRGTGRPTSDPFWERVDAQTPGLDFIWKSLIAAPKHLVWDTPANMGRNLKRNFVDTWSESDNAIHVAQDLIFGIPNTMMIGFNGMVDSVEQLQSDVLLPVMGGILFWPPRLLTGLLEGVPVVYPVLDVFPKAMWSGGMVLRKTMIVTGDQTQKSVNLLYKTIHDPDEWLDHMKLYWGAGKSSTHPAPGAVQPVVTGLEPDSEATAP